MFFFFDLLTLGAMGGGALYLYRDYRNGFTKTKALVGKAARVLGVGNVSDENTRANEAVERFAKGLGTLRDAVAEVETNYKMALKQQNEQQHLALRFGEILTEAMRKGDETAASVAAVAKINAEQRERFTRSTLANLLGLPMYFVRNWTLRKWSLMQYALKLKPFT